MTLSDVACTDRPFFSVEACVNHPILTPDAWSEISNGRPSNNGIKAWLVCRFACPVRESCPFDDGQEIIAKGGWFDSRGRFVKPPDDRMELRQAVVYLGISEQYLRKLIKLHGIKTVSGPSAVHISYLRIEDVEDLALSLGPRHGTAARYELHLLRGEQPCNLCYAAETSPVAEGYRY